MKKYVFTEKQVSTMVLFLERLKIEGLQQARALATIGAIIDEAEEREEAEEDETGKSDRNGKQNKGAAV